MTTDDEVVRLLGDMAAAYRERHSLDPDDVLIVTCHRRHVARARAAITAGGHDHVVVVPRVRVGWLRRLRHPFS